MPRKRYDLDLLNTPVETIEESITREYPPPVKEPCNDCPWRRDSTAGWLGPYDADFWLEIAHGEAPIACHQTIPPGGGWGDRTGQCRGAAIFRANVCKSPKNPSIETGPADRERVFARSTEFKDHHERTTPVHVYLSMKHEALVGLHRKLGEAIASNPGGRDGGTTVEYDDAPDKDSVYLTISNDDMERDEVPADAIYHDAM